MQLNIKDPETHQLVARLSKLTGLSKSGAIKDAVRGRIEELERTQAVDYERRLAEVRRLTASIRSRLPKVLPTQAEMDGWFYDDDGLPRSPDDDEVQRVLDDRR